MTGRTPTFFGTASLLMLFALALSSPADASPTVPTATVGAVPLTRQVYRNNCETAALSMLLAAIGIRVDQRTLQTQLTKSGPLDPIVTDSGTWIWGDPDLGYVGRAAGGGTAGGFGVYQRPIQRLAKRHGAPLTDLTGRNVSAVVGRLRSGRPVMAWIGLRQGPYRRWRSPTGRSIVVNFGEHVVVLSRIRGETITIHDPLTGGVLEWTIQEFTKQWRLLGKRALSL